MQVQHCFILIVNSSFYHFFLTLYLIFFFFLAVKTILLTLIKLYHFSLVQHLTWKYLFPSQYCQHSCHYVLGCLLKLHLQTWEKLSNLRFSPLTSVSNLYKFIVFPWNTSIFLQPYFVLYIYLTCFVFFSTFPYWAFKIPFSFCCFESFAFYSCSFTVYVN